MRRDFIVIRKQLATLNARMEKDAGTVLQFLREVSNSADGNLVWLDKDKGLKLCVFQKDMRKDIARLLFTQDRCSILPSVTISDKQTGTPEEKMRIFHAEHRISCYRYGIRAEKIPF